MNEEELQVLAKQLKHPQGEKGLEIAEMMNETNIGMTHHSIDRLNLQDGEYVLELGHGNCGHLAYLLNKANNLVYHGLEMSELMHQEAQRINQTFVDKQQAHFHLYDGKNFPFSPLYFDKIFTVNTIYFWKKPSWFLSSLHKLLKPGGMMNITFGQKSFMEQLPFTRFEFELYDNEKITDLISATPFSIVGIESKKENVKTKTGELVERDFTTVSIA